MDDFCGSKYPECLRRGTSDCKSSGAFCNARSTPPLTNKASKWRCLVDKAMNDGGQIWDGEDACVYSLVGTELSGIALKYPVLGDFEKQLWLDTFCQNQIVSVCSEPYFAQYNDASQELICRTVNTNSSTCPVKNGIHQDLVNMVTRGMDMHIPNFIVTTPVNPSIRFLIVYFIYS